MSPSQLNHINLCASEGPALTSILERHFGYRTLQSGRVPDSAPGGAGGVGGAGAEFAFLVGEDSAYIVISQIAPRPDGGSSYPPQFHFGLMQESADAVYAKHAELTAAGLEPGEIGDSFEVFGAVWTGFYCPVGDGLEIEVNHRTRSHLLDRAQSSTD